MGVFYSFTVSTVPYITKSKLNVKLHIIQGACTCIFTVGNKYSVNGGIIEL